jgi:1-acyl-sn-glycerol-3-phosphate acyltransferase
MKPLRDWLFTVPFLITFGIILLVFDLAQRIARLFGQRPQEYVAGALQVALVWAFRICDARVTVERSPHVRPRTPYLIVANHQSMFDIPIFGALFFTNFPKYVSKQSLAKWIPSISYNLRRGGHALIDRGDPDQAIGAIQELAAQVRSRGVSAMIFPEGTRARHGEMGKFRPRGTLALLEAAPDVEVVPVCIDQSWRILRHNMKPIPFGVRVHVWIGDPIPRRPGEDREALLRRVEDEIRTAMERYRDDGREGRRTPLASRDAAPKRHQHR